MPHSSTSFTIPASLGLRAFILALLVAGLLLAGTPTQVHAYGGDSGGSSSDGSDPGGGGGGGGGKDAQNFGKLTPADLIRAFGTKEQKRQLEERIKLANQDMRDARENSGQLREELGDLRKELSELSKEIKAGDHSVEKENEYFEKWRKAIQKQYEVKKAEADRLVTEKNSKLAEDGLESLSPEREAKIRDYVKAEADKTFRQNAERMADKLLQYGEEARDEAEARDRQIMRWTVVKYASMAGVAGISGVAIIVKATTVGISTLSAAEAAQLLTIATALDVTGATAGSVADSVANKQSVTETFVRGLSAASVQYLGGKLLGKLPETTTATRQALVEFCKSLTMDEIQTALGSIPAPKDKPTTAPSAPSYRYPIATQEFHM